uniref:Aminocarboxymuconate-semialdehyde decarboxylase n=1 Tax=Solanum tuberosum TaxID=4113 RepID=M1A2S1_SOLTU
MAVAGEGQPQVIDSHLHVWASPQEAAEKYPYFPGQEPSLTGNAEFLLEVPRKGFTFFIY